MKLLRTYSMQQAGYPFEKNDLSFDEWNDLARVKQLYQSGTGCPFMGRSE